MSTATMAGTPTLAELLSRARSGRRTIEGERARRLRILSGVMNQYAAGVMAGLADAAGRLGEARRRYARMDDGSEVRGRAVAEALDRAGRAEVAEVLAEYLAGRCPSAIRLEQARTAVTQMDRNLMNSLLTNHHDDYSRMRDEAAALIPGLESKAATEQAEAARLMMASALSGSLAGVAALASAAHQSGGRLGALGRELERWADDAGRLVGTLIDCEEYPST